MKTFAKIVVLAAAVTLPSIMSTVASAKGMMAPAGSCAIDKKHFVATNTMCSFNCNPQTQWCSQQYCLNGTLTPMLPCYTGFCTAKCGG